MAATKRKKPKVATRPFLKHGGKKIEIPLLKGPVGPEAADLRKKYPTLNTPIDVELIQYYLAELVDIRYLSVSGNPEWVSRCLVDPVKGIDAAFTSAIKQFQSKMSITDSEETSQGIIKPDGTTLKALVDYSDYAGQLDSLKHRIQNPADYIFYGSFDMDSLMKEYAQAFSSDPRYSPKSEPKLRELLAMMSADPYFIDIRWMAYVLATVCWETTSLTHETHKNAKGKTITTKAWKMSWSPVEEGGHGAGRRYERPVKVFTLPGGGARVTEWDGDQWTVNTDGTNKALTKRASAGVSPQLATPTKVYTDDPGTEFTYFGRGYVQLTWWSNYATAGTKIGLGISLLTSPELALDEDVAYKLMSYCLRTGYGFANGHKLGDFISGGLANYTAARAMVNGTDHANDIAKYAKRFEKLLLEARQ